MPRRLRPELLRFPRADGGVDVLDLVLERVTSFTAAEVALLDDLDASVDVASKVDAALLAEGPLAEALRQEIWNARAHLRWSPPPFATGWDGWGLASSLPAEISPRWRTPEVWRRMGEARLAGRSMHEFAGFVEPDFARAILAEMQALDFQRLETPLVSVWRHPLAMEGTVASWFRAEPLRTLISAVLGVDLVPRVHVNAWQLRVGDAMGVHPDGRRYAATFSLGLNEGWTAAHGGAIAFGTPTDAGFHVEGRWIPHLGDLLLFRPHATSWHAVEPVQMGTRWTCTGWYLPDFG